MNTVSPFVYYVHTDHLHRPMKMTDSAKNVVWDAVWLPFGGLHTLLGLAANLRFPGQWFQSETGLHYNWHRSYDPTLGRYTQPDPLGFVDGPSVYGYARGRPIVFVDKDGRLIFGFENSGSAVLGNGLTGGGGFGYDTNSGTLGSFASGGGACGLDVSITWSLFLFNGDWCDFSGWGETYTIGFGPGSVTFIRSGGKWGYSIGFGV